MPNIMEAGKLIGEAIANKAKKAGSKIMKAYDKGVYQNYAGNTARNNSLRESIRNAISTGKEDGLLAGLKSMRGSLDAAKAAGKEARETAGKKYSHKFGPKRGRFIKSKEFPEAVKAYRESIFGK